MRLIFTERAPKPGNYSQGVLIDPTKYYLLELSGQTAREDQIETYESNQTYFQTFRALVNLLAVVETAGGDIHSFAKLDVSIKAPESPDKEDAVWNTFNVAYADFFFKYGRGRDMLPARSCDFVVNVPHPSEKTVVIITGIAAIPKPKKPRAPRKKKPE